MPASTSSSPPRVVVDSHVRLAAWMHIALGLLTTALALFLAAGLTLLGLVANGYDSRWGQYAPLGIAVVVLLVSVPLVEIWAAVQWMRGRSAGRSWTLVCSIVHLLNVPVGTIIGIYSFWVIFRDPPAPGRKVAAPGGRTAIAAATPRPGASTMPPGHVAARARASAGSPARAGATAMPARAAAANLPSRAGGGAGTPPGSLPTPAPAAKSMVAATPGRTAPAAVPPRRDPTRPA